MKRSSFLLFFLLIGGTTVLAQDNSIKNLRGRVLADGKDVTGVVVRNNTSKRATITDFEGNFAMPVRLNDTLVFLAVQFKSRVLPITSSVFNADFVNVSLEEFVNELDEVVVRPFDLSGDLTKDAENLELPQDVSAETLGLPNAQRKIITQNERKLQEASSMRMTAGGSAFGAGGALSLNPIINALTGRTKMLKKRVAIDKKDAQTQRVQQSVADSLFIVVLKVPKDRIDNFMYFCEADPGFEGVLNTNDELKLWQFMIDKSVVYRKNNGLE
ncbi:hypothetical protein [Allomuricauda sp. SCSIO 65647]|uniref:hypothetical protein n=1 Tax=Allomuricauda sp. SCSIO 65647 TaxID=2908843 RepID=UPI001F392B39|nr:hypothetical protein [Muricauda sp. SCSIO 65647]UJH68148.1 hypothetical protein L0P89_02825 [Muricauda sp. SCSIO 65647]